MITLSPGSVRTMSEALRAASVASATAMPMSAFFNAGASFTPSPVIPQIKAISLLDELFDREASNAFILVLPEKRRRRIHALSVEQHQEREGHDQQICQSCRELSSSRRLLVHKAQQSDTIENHIISTKLQHSLAAWSIRVSLSTSLVKTSIRVLSTVSLLRVRVPVLSLQRTSIPAISSMAVILLVMAPCCERRWDPIAIVTDKTVGMAMGMPPMRRTNRLSIPSLYFLCWIGWAAFPKKVCSPVAITTASISPCLQVDPENTSSPGFLVTGRDSPANSNDSGTFHDPGQGIPHKPQELEKLAFLFYTCWGRTLAAYAQPPQLIAPPSYNVAVGTLRPLVSVPIFTTIFRKLKA
nr:hypothetical protein ZEAMMB73_Zm00001d050215 [Ipomoea batatas]